MHQERIGCISEGIDGTDTYVRYELTPEEQDACPTARERSDLVYEKLENTFGYECRGPGTQFCNQFTVIPMPYSNDRFIGIAHIRWDI